MMVRNKKCIKHFVTFSAAIFFLLIFSNILTAQQKLYLTMEDGIARALSRNNQVRASYFAMKMASWDSKYAWTLHFPTVSLNTRFTHIDDETFALRDFSRYFKDTPSIPGLPEFDIPQTVFQDSYFTSFDVTFPLLNMAVLNGISIARANAEMATYQNQSTKDHIIFQVVSNYLHVLRSKDILELQKEYLSLSKLNYEKAERLYNAGRYSKTEVLRWNVDYQQQRSTVVNSESDLRSAFTILNRLVNAGVNEEIQIDDRVPDILVTESENLARLADDEIIAMIRLSEQDLVRVNAALSSAKAAEKAAKRLYRNSYTSFLPTISLSYSYGWRENSTLALDDYSPQTLMLHVSVPIFNSFQNFSSTKAAYYEFKQGQEQYYDQLQNTRLILNETVNKIINLKTQRQLSSTNVEYNEHNYRIVEQQKEKGLVSNIDFIDAKLNLQDAKLNDISTNYDFISAMVELYYLLGKLDKIM